MTKNQLINQIANCNSMNGIDCEYCKRANNCKEYQEYQKIKQIENDIQIKQDLWEQANGSNGTLR